MAAKNDPAPTPAPEAAPVVAVAPPRRSPLATLLPLVLVLVLSPAITWAVVTFVLFPQLDKKIAAAKPGDPVLPAGSIVETAPVPVIKGGKDGDKKAVAPNAYEFTNVVVNLAGTMGTRYLKTSFLVTGKGNDVNSQFEGNKPRLVDVTLNVLSSLTLADLEEAGAKNLIRERLVGSYNQAFGRKIADQVYFSDFVVQ